MLHLFWHLFSSLLRFWENLTIVALEGLIMIEKWSLYSGLFFRKDGSFLTFLSMLLSFRFWRKIPLEEGVWEEEVSIYPLLLKILHNNSNQPIFYISMNNHPHLACFHHHIIGKSLPHLHKFRYIGFPMNFILIAEKWVQILADKPCNYFVGCILSNFPCTAHKYYQFYRSLDCMKNF